MKKNDIVENEDLFIMREDFVSTTTSIQDQKNRFAMLDDKKKLLLWKSKLNHILGSGISEEGKINLIEIEHIISNTESFYGLQDNVKFKKSLVSLATFFNEEDLSKMFLTLESFPSYRDWDIVIKDEKALANKIKLSFNEFDKSSQSSQRILEECNCSWTCDTGSPFYGEDCDSTSYGCGFLFIFSCNAIS